MFWLFSWNNKVKERKKGESDSLLSLPWLNASFLELLSFAKTSTTRLFANCKWGCFAPSSYSWHTGTQTRQHTLWHQWVGHTYCTISHSHLGEIAKRVLKRVQVWSWVIMVTFVETYGVLRKKSHPTHCRRLLLSGFWTTTNAEAMIPLSIVSWLCEEHISLAAATSIARLRKQFVTVCTRAWASKWVSAGCSLCCDSLVSWAAVSGVFTAAEGAAAWWAQLPSCSSRLVVVLQCSSMDLTCPLSRASTRSLWAITALFSRATGLLQHYMG